MARQLRRVFALPLSCTHLECGGEREPLQQSTLGETAGVRTGNNDGPLLWSYYSTEWWGCLSFRVMWQTRMKCVLQSEVEFFPPKDFASLRTFS